ncbi:MAG: hypothetical protein Q9179_007362 [Wetmoreana sp. 5 TL-2023]
MLARQSVGYEAVAERFHTIYFLATPHRGSDSARLLSNMLQAANLARGYITDLERGSVTLQSINDEYRNYSGLVKIWSFYETQKLKMGITSTLIVDPESAMLGYPGEEQIPMNADHRSICKFDTNMDPNYVVLRNALATTVQKISTPRREMALMSLKEDLNAPKAKESLRQRQLEDLAKFLEVSEDFEDEFATVKEARLAGTCEWLWSKQRFQTWYAAGPESPRMLWVTGKPAAGKSVLAGYVIDRLRQMHARCSYFFFRHGDTSKSKIALCLRHLAFQMASQNEQVLNILSEMRIVDKKIDIDNGLTVCRKVFVSGILQADIPTHYWVLDALDECSNIGFLFNPMLTSIDNSMPLRIFATSRETPELHKQTLSLGSNQIHHEQLSTADTLADMELLINARTKLVPLDSADHRAKLASRILVRSEGSFLWTTLVLSELSNSYSEEDIDKSLEDMPRKMERLYHRTLSTMAQATGGRKLALAILPWASCAMYPLTTKELQGALKCDVGDTFRNLEESITAVCGQMVIVDKSKKVQMVHETAREFILDENLESEFAVRKMQAHTRIARACLTYLTGEEMKPPRSSRRGATINLALKRPEFSNYACGAFSYHLARADPLMDDILSLTDKFLKTNILSWIEVIAQTQNLNPMIRVAKNLKKYFNLCAAVRSPLGSSMHNLKCWTTDLVRMVAKFAPALATSPSAIYSLIAPFCPLDSAIRSVSNAGRNLRLLGLSDVQWDDRLSCIDFRDRRATAIAYGDGFFAVSTSSGTITVYHATSCQEYKSLIHGEVVNLLEFESKTELLASCGMKLIRVWELRNGQNIYSFPAPQRIMGLAFHQGSLLAASSRNYLALWDLHDNGIQQPNRPWNDMGEDLSLRPARAPSTVSLSVSHQMLAVAHNGRPIMLWDLAEDTYYGSCGKKLPNGETSTHMVTALVFNSNPNIELMAVSYLDGELVLVNPFNDQELGVSRANCHTLAASPNGCFLAGGAGSGTIEIYGFETLRLLYRVKSSNLFIKQLAFSADSLRFSDIRGSHCNVWEPLALLRDSVDDDSSEATSTSIVDVVTSDTNAKITAIFPHPKGGFVFCGKDDGSVCAYSLKSGDEISKLYQHKTLLRIVSWWQLRNALISVDASNVILVWKLKLLQNDAWKADSMIVQFRLSYGHSIISVLHSESVDKFVLSTRCSDHLCSIDCGEEQSCTREDKGNVRKWIQHQQSEDHIVCLEGEVAAIYTWKHWTKIASIPLTAAPSELQMKNAFSFSARDGPRILIELSEAEGSFNTHALSLFDSAPLAVSPNPNEPKEGYAESNKAEDNIVCAEESPAMTAPTATLAQLLDPQLAVLAPQVAHTVGIRNGKQLVFLDIRSWICSVDLESLATRMVYSRHFFVPYDWFAGTRDILCTVIGQDVVLVRNGDVAVVKGGLEFVEFVDLHGSGERTWRAL